jgi:hypothetical protein
MTCISMLKQIAEKSIHRSRWRGATWSTAGQLDWWVKERQEWLGRYAVQTAVNAGSGLLIFVPRALTAMTAVDLRETSRRSCWCSSSASAVCSATISDMDGSGKL